MSDRIEAADSARSSANDGDVEDVQGASGAGRVSRVYAAPKLIRLGSVRDLTLGGSGGRKSDVGTKFRVK